MKDLQKYFLNCIKEWYVSLETSLNNGDDLETQFLKREILNQNIRLYLFCNGKENIDKYMKYYV